ncbi:ATP-dependent DNA helicase RecG [Nicoliella spurrieriana]|uniref:ATP-dependent DNA helicase RecG n=1 Tax=Nicoliella spurrieriana TaxID=2925830 RepID=A0A976RTH4_9LACO|nr:ATP-dependent DNA helicase RecG [Nicoliella spurrieriana]UQS87517.1 ATP-dependent DNA helicase RecG [Nicoliella spurrieriana]
MDSLNNSVSTLEGIGPKKELVLNSLGIKTINDLLNYFPFRYDNFKIQSLATLPPQAQVTLKGVVVDSPSVYRYGYKKSKLTFLLQVEHAAVRVNFFNQPWLAKQITVNQPLVVYGRFDRQQMAMAAMKIISNATNQMAPIYSVNKQIKQQTLRKLIQATYEKYQAQIEDFIPESLRKRYRLESHRQVVHDMHFPADLRASKLALRTAKFEEFFIFQMRMQLLRMRDHHFSGIRINYDIAAINQFINALPFKLTGAQNKVVTEILHNLGDGSQMNRLLQGDVGSGKTIVAAIAIYATITAGYQAALMVPTEILAEQHANGLAKIFANLPVNIALLTGDTKPAVRREILPRIKDGEINLVIGTHALIQDEVNFHNLGLAIIDEQHRFGVNQRAALRKKGDDPNVLTMTATPIPRTMTITTYGEMDVSVINELPAGRKPIVTRWINSKQVSTTFPFLLQHLSHHEQMYVIAPLIEESDKSDMQSTETMLEMFQRSFPGFQVGLLHGRMKDAEKNAVMEAFKRREIQILVSTTVIEVGVDVPNASLMMIFNADHFGLAQLHQLRGRVGRGDQQSYCILVADPKTEVGKKRMNVMVETTDGFIVAQKDLELRGSGDVMGKQQSGQVQFKIGDPVADLVMLSYAQEEAKRIVNSPHWNELTDNLPLVKYLNDESLTDSLD